MLKTYWKFISAIERIGDNLLIVLAFFLSYVQRPLIVELLANLGFELSPVAQALGPIDNYYIVMALSLPLYNAVLSMLGAYRSMRRSSAWELIKLGFSSSALVFLALGALLYLLKLDLSRSFLAIFCSVSAIALILERVLILSFLRYFRKRGKNFRNVLIVGTGAQARRVYTEILRQPELGLRAVGFVSVHDSIRPEVEESDESTEILDVGSAVYDLPARVVADVATFEKTLKKYSVDEVFCTDVLETFSQLKVLSEIAVEEGVRVSLAADLFSLEIFQSDMSYLGKLPFLHYHPSAGVHDGLALAVKRMIDVVLSSLALIVLSPFLALIGILVKLSSPGPIFFRQKRIGLNGRQFTMLKFRTMVQDAERLLPDLMSKNEMSGPAFKMKHDPRVTPVGRFLRRFSLDEFPQLWNVLLGEMSLVGPRPPLPGEVSLYVRKHRKRLSMRPGLTCIWQTSGRNEIPNFDDWANLDLEYIDNWSLRKDFELLLRTIPAVLLGSGAR